MPRREDAESRFARKVAPPDENGCRLWTAGVSNGYGQFALSMVDGVQKSVGAHRYAWEREHGPIPDEMTIDHVWARGCRSKLCMETAHMELVTRGENSRRAAAQITHCPKNHPYEGDNLVMKINAFGNPQRVCRTCRNEGLRASRARKKV